ncbi:protein kinase [Candidatus Uabimicrobium sp. HlEnr_7]|uniref:serine/threonine-protein kinase n=1 Tax=Candidatus Uabimicrobium helgolandensis TaxID=3095367 RepID=UPI0035588B8E
MSDNINQKFLQYCLQNKILSTQQVQAILKNISSADIQQPLWEIVGRQLQQDPAKIENTYQQFLKTTINLSDPSKDITLDFLVVIKKLFLQGIISLNDANIILQKKSAPSIEDVINVFARRRILSVEQCMEVRGYLQQLSSMQKQQFLCEAPILAIQNEQVVQKSDFKIAHYEILKEIGRGGMGIVYLARDTKLSRTVALKVMPSMNSDREVQRFIREAKLAASLNHPNIISVYEVGNSQKICYFTMEYIEGMPLNDYARKFKLTPLRVMKLLLPIVQAVNFAHSKNIIHRDIKPGNIIVDSNHNPYLMDFGLAKHIRKGDDLTMSGARIGTPAYMSPEQINSSKNVGKPVDVYSLGIVLYEILVGRTPFTANNIQAIFNAITSQDPVPPKKLIKDLPNDINTICLKCLQKNAKDRYVNAKALQLDIERYTNGQTIKAKPVGHIARFSQIAARNKVLSTIIASLFICVLVLTYKLFLAPGVLNLRTVVKNSQQQLEPLTANIKIDDKISFRSGTSINSGYHKVTLAAPNYESQEFFVHIPPNQEINLEKELQPQTGLLTISSSLSSLNVDLINFDSNEKISVVAPIYKWKVKTGRYRVIANKQNYFPEEQKINVERDTESNLFIEPKAMKVWETQLFEQPLSDTMVITDNDGDGNSEVVYTAKNASVVSYNIKEQQRIWKVQGNNSFSVGKVISDDINGDGIPEIIYSHHYDFKVIDGKSHSMLFQKLNWWGYSFITKDVNNDQRKEIITFSSYKGIECHDIHNNSIVWRIGYNTPRLSNTVHQISPNMALFVENKTNAIMSIDLLSGSTSLWFREHSQNPPKIFASSKKDVVATYSMEKGLRLHNIFNKKIVWSWQNTSPLTTLPIWADLNQDGKQELLVITDKLYCLDSRTKSVIWKKPIAALKIFTADLDFDGLIEVIVYDTKNVWVLDHRGENRCHFTISTTLRKCVSVDIDNDGYQEILCLSDTDLYCYRYHNLANINTISKYIFDNVETISDITNDNIKELVASTKDGVLYCFNGKNHEILWESKISNSSLGITVMEKSIIVLSNKEVVIVEKNGAIKKRFSANKKLSRHHKALLTNFKADGTYDIIVLSAYSGDIYCFNYQGTLVWHQKVERIFASPLLADLDGDKQQELIVTNGMQMQDNDSYVVCFNAINGRVRWKTSIVQHAEASDILLVDIDQDGKNEIIVGGIAGTLNCLKSNGHLYWSRRYACASLHAPYIIEDFDRDGNVELVAKTKDYRLICIDLQQGNVKWLRHKIHSGLMKTIGDYNNDGINDIVSTSPYHSFVVTSGDNGTIIRHNNALGLIQKPLIVDIDSDSQLDVIFLNTSGHIVVLHDWEHYIQKVLEVPKYRKTNHVNKIKHLNMLLRNQNYSILQKDSSYYQNQSSKTSFDFHRAVANIAQKKWQQAQLLAKKILQTTPNHFSARFILMMCQWSTGQTKNAKKSIIYLLQNSIVNFEKQWQHYNHLLQKNHRELIVRFLPYATKKAKTEDHLYRGYHHSIFMQDSENIDKWMKLIVKYSSKNYEGYENISKLFREKTLNAAAAKTTAIYTYHEALAEIKKGLKYLSKDPVLLQFYGQYCLQIDKNKAFSYFSELLSLSPNNAHALYFKGVQLYEQQQYRKALPFLRKSIDYEIELSKKLTYGLCLVAVNERSRAQKFLNTLPVTKNSLEEHLRNILLLLAEKKPIENHLHRIKNYIVWSPSFTIKWLGDQILQYK